MGTDHQAARTSMRGLAFGEMWSHPPLDEARVRIARRHVRPGPWPWPWPWPWTDDTAMALSLLQALLVDGEIRPGALAARFAAEYARDPARGYGRSMRGVLRAIGAGQEPSVESCEPLPAWVVGNV